MSHFNVIDAGESSDSINQLEQFDNINSHNTSCVGYDFNRTPISPPATSTSAAVSVAQILWDFVGPVIFCVGVLGNISILIVMSRPTMRGTSTCAYLMLMAVADLMVLITGMLPEWLDAGKFVTIKELHPYMCKCGKFLFYTSGDTAIWIRVQFTLDRFIAVCFPMTTGDCCLPWRAKFYALGALLAAIVKNAHVFFTRGAEYSFMESYQAANCTWLTRTTTNATLVSNCGHPTLDYKHFETYIRPWIAFALVSVLPFTVILVCNVLIIATLVRVQRKHTELQLMSAAHDRNIFQMTAMCLAASFCFIVCTAPSIIMLIGKPYWNSPPNVSYEIAKAVNNQLYYVNHSANFFLYCVTGKRFRQTLILCFHPGGGQYSNIRKSMRSAYTGSLMVSTSPGPGSGGRGTAAGFRQSSSVVDDGRAKDGRLGSGVDNVHNSRYTSSHDCNVSNSIELLEKVRKIEPDCDIVCVEKRTEGF